MAESAECSSLEAPKSPGKGESIISTLCIVICMIYMISTLYIYTINLKKYHYLYKRNYIFNYIFATGIFLYLVFLLRGLFKEGDYPCMLEAFIPLLSTGLAWSGINTRVMLHFLKLKRNKMVVDEKYLSEIISTERAVRKVVLSVTKKGMKEQKKKKKKSVDRSSVHSSNALTSINDSMETKSSEVSLGFRIISRMATFKFGLVFMAFSTLLDLSILLAKLNGDSYCNGCPVARKSGPFSVGTAIYAVFDLTVAIILFYLVRNEPDPLKIKRELLMALAIISITQTINGILNSVDPGDLQKNGEIDWGIFTLFGLMLVYGVEVPLQVYKAMNESNEDEDYSDLGFQEVLRRKNLKELFSVHLNNEFAMENMHFYDTIELWKERFNGWDEQERIDVANRIVDIYIRSNDNETRLLINISSSTRRQILNAVNDKDLEADTFETAVNEVTRLMATNTLPRFRKSSGFKKYCKTTLRSSDIESQFSGI